MRLCLEGDEATWKTGLAYTSPGKRVGFHFDPGFGRAFYGVKYPELFEGLSVQQWTWERDLEVNKGKKLWAETDITVINFPEPVQIDPDKHVGARPMFNAFLVLIAEAFDDEKVDSIILDTSTLARRIAADSYLESLQATPAGRNRKQLLQIEWGHPNDYIRSIYTTAEGSIKNFIATHHLTPEYQEYVDSDGQTKTRTTGKLLLEGLSNTYRFFDICLRMTKTQQPRYDNPQVKETIIEGKYVKCGYNLDLEGTIVYNPTWDIIARQVNKFIYDPSVKVRTNNGELS